MNAFRTILIRVLWMAVVLLVVAAFAAYVWPTSYRYDHVTIENSTYPVRIHRVSGNADMLVPNQGWIPVEGDIDEPTTDQNTAVHASR